MPYVRGQIKIVLSSRIGQFVKILLVERSSRGGLDELIRRMWLGREIFVVGLPPLMYNKSNRIVNAFSLHKTTNAKHIHKNSNVCTNINFWIVR